MLPGWLNVDLVGRQPIDLALDLRKRFPFPDGSIDVVFHEHVIEHLTYQDAIAVLSECVRVLRPAGVLRVTVPDFGRYLNSYVHGTDFIGAVRPDRFSRLIALSEVAYCYGHRSVWDVETLGGVLEALGLPAQQMDFRQSRLQPCPDSLSRRNETLYMEGSKPE
jgi:predicted SAM-dependent methyltransferase